MLQTSPAHKLNRACSSGQQIDCHSSCVRPQAMRISGVACSHNRTTSMYRSKRSKYASSITNTATHAMGRPHQNSANGNSPQVWKNFANGRALMCQRLSNQRRPICMGWMIKSIHAVIQAARDLSLTTQGCRKRPRCSQCDRSSNDGSLNWSQVPTRFMTVKNHKWPRPRSTIKTKRKMAIS